MAEGRPAPLRSMTGYGRGAAAHESVEAEVELRSVNGRGLSTKLRLPNDRLELEGKVEALVRAAIERGTIQGQVRVRLLETHSADIDRAVVRRYLEQWRAVEIELGLEQRDPQLSELLALPGTVQAPAEPECVTEAVRRAVTEAADHAVAALLEAREREGAKLGRELRALLGRLRKALDQAEKRLPAAQAEAGARLRERVRAAWEAAGLSEPIDLARELVVLAERADVREEVARLRIHLERLAALLDAGGAAGRELEFLIQECHREVTTLGNKSSDRRLAELVMRMKLLVGQLKEQAANVE